MEKEINIAEINPFVRYVAQTNFSPLKERVRAYDHRVFFVLKGEFCLNIEGTDYELKPDSMAVVRPGDAYIFRTTGGLEIIDINFDYTQDDCEAQEGVTPSFAEKFEEKRRFGRPVFTDCPQMNHSFVIHNMPEFRDELSKIVNEFELRKVFYREKASALLKGLIYDTARCAAGEHNEAGRKLDEVLKYIKTHYSNELSSAQIAVFAGYHPYYLNRLMKSYTGITLWQYIINCRIDAAKKLLRNTEMPMDEISEKCGFRNITHFSDCFKNKAGVSATVYRRSFKKIL